MRLRDLPSDPVAKNPPTNVGDGGSIPGLGRFYIAKGQLSLCAAATEPASLQPVLQNRRSLPSAAGEKPHSPKLEKAWAWQQRPSIVRKKLIKYMGLRFDIPKMWLKILNE